MIVFITEDWQLDLTDHKITFVEENSLFFDYFVSGYSLPFSILISDELALQLGFVSENNITDYETRYQGVLQQDGSFSPAILVLDEYDGERLSGSFVYGNQTIPLLDTKLSDLPFPVISTEDIEVHAKSVIEKGFPEVGYNFPMIIDKEFDQKTNYENFEGILNKYTGTAYVRNSRVVTGDEEIIYNRNVITPYPYILEILKVGFEHAGLSYAGDFFSDPLNSKLIWDTGIFLEQLFSPLPPSFRFGRAITNVIEGNNVVSSFRSVVNINSLGSYTIKAYLNLPDDMFVREYTISIKGKVVYESSLQRLDKLLTINMEKVEDFGVLELKMIIVRYNEVTSIDDVSKYNNFTFWSNDGQLNVFPDSFTLADVMPSMTFSTFLNKLKNWFNLDIDFQYDTVTIDYVEQKFLETTFRDETHLEAEKYSKKSNKNKGYELKDSQDTIYVDKSGIVKDLSKIKKENIVTINTGVSVMKIENNREVFTARRLENSEFRVLLYDGLQNGLPVAVSSIDDQDISLISMYNRLWKNWIRFRIHSETIKDKFKCDIYEDLNTNEGRYKYNKKQLVKKISKRRIDRDVWEVRVESEVL
ncbi:hypothetical protein AWE51_00300 [Aquimarina aggregata]|uniref:Uncharacterized protein n=1 Tax=Aquimarina aggregata TaxID=1642818 RepID=A0A163BZL5_9FLAO|nr:hypothetical protein [Aquimarina aggregata]KZS41922.1 hypothetical protein AWE51_00300 [Aquimarina aggregata]